MSIVAEARLRSLRRPSPCTCRIHLVTALRGLAPSPYPPYAQVANATWVLTDYDRDNGSTCFVDGSHLLCRPPSPAEYGQWLETGVCKLITIAPEIDGSLQMIQELTAQGVEA